MVHGLAALDANAIQHSYKGVEIEPNDDKNKPPVRRCLGSSVQTTLFPVAYDHSRLCASQAGLYTAVAIYFLCGNAVLLPW